MVVSTINVAFYIVECVSQCCNATLRQRIILIIDMIQKLMSSAILNLYME